MLTFANFLFRNLPHHPNQQKLHHQVLYNEGEKYLNISKIPSILVH